MIRNNWQYKFLSVVIALILMFYVNSERNPQSRKPVRVTVQAVNPARGYTVEVEPRRVSVSVQGLKSAVDSIGEEEIQALVDLSKLRADRGVIEKVLPIQIQTPRMSDDEDLSFTPEPREVKITMEALSEKRLPVDVDFATEPPVGYSYTNPVLTPASVSLSGKITQIAKVKRAVVTLEGDSNKGATEGYYEVSPVDAKGNEVQGIDINPQKVHLKLDMVEVPATKAVIISPAFSGEPKFPAKVTRYAVNPSSVTLEGKPSVLAGISTISTDKIQIDGADSTVSHEVALRVPSGVKVVGDDTVKITVYISSN